MLYDCMHAYRTYGFLIISAKNGGRSAGFRKISFLFLIKLASNIERTKRIYKPPLLILCNVKLAQKRFLGEIYGRVAAIKQLPETVNRISKNQQVLYIHSSSSLHGRLLPFRKKSGLFTMRVQSYILVYLEPIFCGTFLEAKKAFLW